MKKFIICLKFYKDKTLFQKIKDIFSEIKIKSKYGYILMEISDYRNCGINDPYIKKVFILQKNYIRLIKNSIKLDITIKDIKFMHHDEELEEKIFQYLNLKETASLIDLILEEECGGNDIKSIYFNYRPLEATIEVFNKGLIGVRMQDEDRIKEILETSALKTIMGVV